MKKSVAVFFVVFVGWLVTGLLGAFGGEPERAAQTDDIHEAIFRYMFEHNGSSQPERPKAYYLAIASGQKRSDPSEAFIKRFAGHQPPVKKVSECAPWTADKGARDKTTRETGLIARVGDIRWKSDTEVEVNGGYDEGPLSSLGYRYWLTNAKGKWKVTKVIRFW